MNYDGPAIADALARARHRMKRDEALLRQALEALEVVQADVKSTPNAYEAQRQAIAALRERLGGTK